jgi:mitochondrial fission protein ELM1
VHASDSPKTGKLILIGGPSKTHGWDGEAMLDMLAKITVGDGWQLTDSRRTPNGFLDQARVRLEGLEIFSCQQTPPDWLPSKLREADEVWVSEDSVSMIYEALSSGARVGLLSAPRFNPNSRVLRGIDELVEAGYLTPFSAWQRTGQLRPAPEALNEAERCAGIVLGK